MSGFSEKKVDFDSFKIYIQQKNAFNLRLAPFYNRYLFRKLKLGSYLKSNHRSKDIASF
jgi:hypothetical protein